MDIEELRRLRREGLTFRDIESQTGIPKSTVHKLLKDIQPDRQRELISLNEEPYAVLDGALVCTPWTYFCPACGQEQQRFFLCWECGRFVPADCRCAGASDGWYLSEMRRGQWTGCWKLSMEPHIEELFKEKRPVPLKMVMDSIRQIKF